MGTRQARDGALASWGTRCIWGHPGAPPQGASGAGGPLGIVSSCPSLSPGRGAGAPDPARRPSFRQDGLAAEMQGTNAGCAVRGLLEPQPEGLRGNGQGRSRALSPSLFPRLRTPHRSVGIQAQLGRWPVLSSVGPFCLCASVFTPEKWAPTLAEGRRCCVIAACVRGAVREGCSRYKC